LEHVKILILDEADRMLDMGFVNDVKKIIAKVPAKRQTLFFRQQCQKRSKAWQIAF
jgi:ATP-dependent RNA helicase RhlE